MVSQQELQPLMKRIDFNHPLFDAYQIKVIPLETPTPQYVLQIKELSLLIESTHPNIKTGMVKLLEEEARPSRNPQIVQLSDKSYQVSCNLALLTTEQSKAFKKQYKTHYQQWKKALKDYERWVRRQQREKIKAARQIRP